jgi:hypothetical protein
MQHKQPPGGLFSREQVGSAHVARTRQRVSAHDGVPASRPRLVHRQSVQGDSSTAPRVAWPPHLSAPSPAHACASQLGELCSRGCQSAAWVPHRQPITARYVDKPSPLLGHRFAVHAGPWQPKVAPFLPLNVGLPRRRRLS